MFFESHFDWAAKVAIEMHRGRFGRFDVEDLVQEARIGLWKAAQRYDPSSPVRFPVFASTWVKGAVLMATRRSAYFHSQMLSLEEAGTRATAG